MNNDHIVLIEKYWDQKASEYELRTIKDLMHTDAEFRSEFVEACRLSGMIKSATHEDAECENLMELINVAIGDGKTSEFEDKVLDLIEKIEPQKLKTPKKIMDTAARKKVMLSTQKSKKYRPPPSPRSRSGSFFWFATAATIAIVCGLYFLNKNKDLKQSRTITIAQIINSDSGIIIKRNGEKLNAKNLNKICLNDVLEGTSGVEIKLKYQDGTVISIKDNSKVSFSRTPSGGKKIKLDYGFMEADVAKQTVGKELIIWTPKASATVLGTKFRIDAFSTYSSLTVTKGLVGFERHSDRKYIKVPAEHFAVTSWDSFVAKSLKPVPKVAKVAHSKPEHVKLASPPVLDNEPKVASFSLVDAETGKVIKGYENIKDGMLINLSKVNAKTFNITANTIPEKVSFVRVSYADPNNKTYSLKEEFHPYSILGDELNRGGEYKKWNLINGSYEIKAQPFQDKKEGQGLTVKFKVINADR